MKARAELWMTLVAADPPTEAVEDTAPLMDAERMVAAECASRLRSLRLQPWVPLCPSNRASTWLATRLTEVATPTAAVPAPAAPPDSAAMLERSSALTLSTPATPALPSICARVTAPMLLLALESATAPVPPTLPLTASVRMLPSVTAETSTDEVPASTVLARTRAMRCCSMVLMATAPAPAPLPPTCRLPAPV